MSDTPQDKLLPFTPMVTSGHQWSIVYANLAHTGQRSEEWSAQLPPRVSQGCKQGFGSPSLSLGWKEKESSHTQIGWLSVGLAAIESLDGQVSAPGDHPSCSVEKRLTKL